MWFIEFKFNTIRIYTHKNPTSSIKSLFSCGVLNSSNFIQPAELLEFAKRLKSHRPPYKLTLDLRKNPGDRDPNTWCAALKILCSFCDVLVEGWISTNTMADHISNMWTCEWIIVKGGCKRKKKIALYVNVVFVKLWSVWIQYTLDWLTHTYIRLWERFYTFLYGFTLCTVV